MEEHKFYGYILEQFTLDGTSRALVRNILTEVGKMDLSKEERCRLLSSLLDGIGLTEEEIEHFS